MIKYSRKTGQSLNDLQMALDLMLRVLKNLNDSLHVVGLKGFPVSNLITCCVTSVCKLFSTLCVEKVFIFKNDIKMKVNIRSV